MSASFDLATAITNLSASFENLQRMIVAISYVIGVGMVVKGIMMYRVFANQSMSSAQRGEFAGPLVWIVIGVLLIWFPTTLDSTLLTIFADSTLGDSNELIAYLPTSGADQWKSLSEVIVKYVKLIGLIAFLRGWIILSKMGHSGAQPGSIGKGAIHVIGGVLLINIVDTVQVLATTFGYT
tara:strand:+ start:40465 stop:41007 length:543 start_codon:yes stop_codon:yes gene_type:complete